MVTIPAIIPHVRRSTTPLPSSFLLPPRTASTAARSEHLSAENSPLSQPLPTNASRLLATVGCQLSAAPFIVCECPRSSMPDRAKLSFANFPSLCAQSNRRKPLPLMDLHHGSLDTPGVHPPPHAQFVPPFSTPLPLFSCLSPLSPLESTLTEKPGGAS